MKKILFLLILIGLISCEGAGLRDGKHNLQKSIHITCKGDTIVSYGGTLYHFDNKSYSLHEAIE